MPVLDGGFSLQFSPLMEYREGKGMILFCQIDVTGRTEDDPVAETLVRNILRYVSTWTAPPKHDVLYAGNPDGKLHLELAGFAPHNYPDNKLSTNSVLVVGSGGGKKLADHASDIADFVHSGGNILAVGLDATEANAFLPIKVEMKKAEHISTFFDPLGKNSRFAGISPADVHNRDPRPLSLLTSGAIPIGNGVLGQSANANIVFCQLAPYEVFSSEGTAATMESNRTDHTTSGEPIGGPLFSSLA